MPGFNPLKDKILTFEEATKILSWDSYSLLRKANEGVTMIFPDRKLAKKKYTKKFVEELIKQVPKIKYGSLHDRQFNSLFWLNN